MKNLYFFILHYECSTAEPFNSHYFTHKNELIQLNRMSSDVASPLVCFRDSVPEDVSCFDVENLDKSINGLSENQCSSTPGDHSFIDITIL